MALSKIKLKRELADIFCCNFYLAKLASWPRLVLLRELYLQTKPKQNIFSSESAQLEAHSQSPFYSEQTCATRFASHLHNLKMLYKVKLYYTVYILTPLFQEVLMIWILLGLVSIKELIQEITSVEVKRQKSDKIHSNGDKDKVENSRKRIARA